MKPWEKDRKDKNFNEFYTLYEECELIFRPLVYILQDKHIHCPCDDDDSNIVKWLKKNTNSHVTFSGLPDIDMNSDKAKELMLKADIVITNPPFSMKHWRPFFIWLNDIYVKKYHKDYFIFGPLPISRSIRTIMDKAIYIYSIENSRDNMRSYMTPHNGVQRAATMWYTSLYCKPLSIVYKPSKKEQEYYKSIPIYDRSENVPPDYGDWMYVPVTYLRHINLKDYEIDLKAEQIPGKFVRYKLRKRGKI